MTVVSNDAADQSADYDVAIVQQPDRHWCPIETPTACVCCHSSSPNNNKTSKVSDSLMMIFTFIGRKQQLATEWQRQHQQQRRNHLLFSRSEVGNLCFCFDLFNKVFVCWFIWRYEGKRKSLLNVNIMWGFDNDAMAREVFIEQLMLISSFKIFALCWFQRLPKEVLTASEVK